MWKTWDMAVWEIANTCTTAIHTQLWVHEVSWDNAVSWGYQTQLLTLRKVRMGSTWAFEQLSLWIVLTLAETLLTTIVLPQSPALSHTAVVLVAWEEVKGGHIWLCLCNICLVSGTIYRGRIPHKGHQCNWFYITSGMDSLLSAIMKNKTKTR